MMRLYDCIVARGSQADRRRRGRRIERDAYRAHLGGRPRCLHDFGGEREIERVIGPSRGRGQERWEPDRRLTLARPRPGI